MDTFYVQVILSGGTCKIPRLQSLVSENFCRAEVLCSASPDEVLAKGAAIEATNVMTKHIKPSVPSTLAVNGSPHTNNQPKESKKSKKKSRSAPEKSKPDVMRSHLPVLVSVLSVPVWCLVSFPL
jgi:molecular chaperone DnaK (HSP70)